MTKIFVIIFLQLFIITTCFADSQETVLPLTFSQNSSAFNVQIQGKTIPVILDTGDATDSITLSPEALKGIKVVFTGKQVCTGSSSGQDCMQSFIIPQIKIGSFVLQNVQGQLMPHIWGNAQGMIMTQAWKDGVVGLPLLKNFGVLIDYPNSRLVFTKNYQSPSGINLANWTKIPFVFDTNIATTAEINGTPVKLIWDTGTIPSCIKASIPIKADISECPDRYNIVIPQCKRIRSASFVVDNQKLENTWFIVRDMPEIPFDGFVGSNFFDNNLVFIDFKNNNLFIKPFQLIL